MGEHEVEDRSDAPGRGAGRERQRLETMLSTPEFLRRHDPARPGNVYLALARSRAVLSSLRRLLAPEPHSRYLEVGCGEGLMLKEVLKECAGLRNVVGVDLLQRPLRQARQLDPALRLACADAALLPFRDRSFDAVGCYLLLSTLKGRGGWAGVVGEMMRVLRPGGYLFVLDLRYPPRTPRGRSAVSARRLRSLFRSHPVESRTHVLLPFLARILAARWPGVCLGLERVPALRAYRLSVFRKSGGAHDSGPCLSGTPGDP